MIVGYPIRRDCLMAISRSDLVAALAEKADTSKTKADAVLSAFSDILIDAVDKGEKVSIPGIVSVERVKIAARTSRKSSTGETFQIPDGFGVKVSVGSPTVRTLRAKTDKSDLAKRSTEVRTALLTEAVGGSANLARLLNVSKSQTTRWKSGQSAPNPETARVLLDLDHVVARASMLWTPSVTLEWLDSPNAFLGGSTPLNVIEVRGATEVVEALDAALAGSYA